MEREMRGELEEEYPPSWNFKDEGEGAEIMGRVSNMRLATFTDKETQERKQQRIAVLETSTGKKTIWLTRVLSSQFGREDVSIGDFIGVKYLGMAQPEGPGNAYHNFKVRVRKPEGTQVDWSQPDGSQQRRQDDLPAYTGGDAPDADFAGADDDIPF
jgi:hypothetical protein